VYKIIWLVKFRRDMEHEEVLRWWRGHHGDLAAATPGMVRYVQNYWTEPLSPKTFLPEPGGETAFDGHAEHWFESRESFEAAMASEQWKRTVEDGPTGFDSMSGTAAGGVLSEHVVSWEPQFDGRLYTSAETVVERS
jgi:uncharacterized protein (TIGR02118 family)